MTLNCSGIIFQRAVAVYYNYMRDSCIRVRALLFEHITTAIIATYRMLLAKMIRFMTDTATTF